MACSIGLLVFALISRGQAISRAGGPRSLARSPRRARTGCRPSIPELSILLAMRAVRTSPTPDSLFALRAAIDASPLRMTLLRPAQVGCQFGGGPSLAYDPSTGRLARAVRRRCRPLADVRPAAAGMFDAGTGRVVLPDPDRAGAAGPMVAYSPDGSLLRPPASMATPYLLDARWGVPARSARGVGIRSGPRKGAGPGNHASPQGGPSSPDGSLLAVVTSEAKIWSLRRRTALAVEGSAVPVRNGPGLSFVGCVHARRPVAGRGGVGRRSCVRRPHRDAAQGATGYRSGGHGRCREPRREPARRGIGLKKRGRRWSCRCGERTWHQSQPWRCSRPRGVTTVRSARTARSWRSAPRMVPPGCGAVRTHDQLSAYLGSTSQSTRSRSFRIGGKSRSRPSTAPPSCGARSDPELASIDTGDSVDDVRVGFGNRVVAALAPDVVRSWLLPGPQPQRPVTRRVANGAGGLFLSPDGAASVEPLAGPPFDSFTGALVQEHHHGQAARDVVAVPPGTDRDRGQHATDASSYCLPLGRRRSPTWPTPAKFTSAVSRDPLLAPSPAALVRGCVSGDGRLAAGTDQCGGARDLGRSQRCSTAASRPPERSRKSPSRPMVATWPLPPRTAPITVWVVQTGRTVHVLSRTHPRGRRCGLQPEWRAACLGEPRRHTQGVGCRERQAIADVRREPRPVRPSRSAPMAGNS